MLIVDGLPLFGKSIQTLILERISNKLVLFVGGATDSIGK
jgi:hypothetical protein